MIAISETLCVGCEKCTTYCPVKLIDMVEGKAYIKEELKKHCLACGHCQGICEQEAIHLFDKNGKLKDAKQNVSIHDLQDLIESNRSIRSFTDERIDNSKLQEILHTLDHTASAKNEQPVRWIVVMGKKKVEEVYELCIKYLQRTNLDPKLLNFIAKIGNPITVNASHILLACAEENSVKPYDDCIIKMSLASLLFHSDGIGSCYLGYLVNFVNEDSALKEYFGITSSQRVYSALAFGYNDNEVYSKIPSRKKAPITFIK